MKPRYGDAVVFAVGAMVAIVALFISHGGLSQFQIALNYFVPGIYMAPLLIWMLAPFLSGLGGAIVGLLLMSGLVNGFVYGLVWYLGRIGLASGRPRVRVATLISLILAVGLWTVGYVQANRDGWAQARPHGASIPVDRSSPFAGRWEGKMHSGQVDEHVVLVCRPHASGTLDGMMYYAGDPAGELENGTIVGDSLYFSISPMEFRGRREGDEISAVEADGSTLSLHRKR